MRNLADRQYFNLRLPVKCRRIERPLTLGPNIIGESLIISSKDLLFTTPEAFQRGQLVEAVIDWPMRMHDSTRLKLVLQGRVVWNTRDHVEMGIIRHEFRTRGAEDPPAAISHAVSV